MKLFKIKPAKNDYIDSMLPKNRKELFFDIFKLHWKSLLFLGIVILLFSLPFIFIEILDFFAKINSNDESVQSIITISNISNLIKVPFILLLSVVLSGTIRVIRQFCWLENVTLSYDFFLGVKQNIRQIFLTMFFVSLFWYIALYSLNLSYLSDNYVKYILALPMGIFLFVIMPITGYMFVSIATYSNSFFQNVKISFIVYISNPFRVILSSLILSIFFVVRFISMNVFIQIIIEMIGFVLMAISLLIFFLISNKKYDECINIHYYPELVNRGLFLK